MLFSIHQQVASALGLALAVSSAPLNERTKLNLLERGVGLGWLCHYDGLAAPSVDATLNLPLMLGGLCAKVNYDYDGCNSFKPLDHTRGDGGAPVHAQSIPQDDGSDADPNADVKPKDANHHKKPKHNAADPDGSVDAQSFNDVDDKPEGQGSSVSPHHKKPKHHTVTAQSFNAADDDDKPNKSHPSSVGALGAESDDSERCQRNEYYSSQLRQCVNKSYFTKAQSDSSCKNGQLDALLKLCLDISLLGLAKPLHAEATVLPLGPGGYGKDACPVGQQLSSLLNVCVDQKFFSNPLADNQCQNGWKLDLVLGICVDILGCQNQGFNN